MFMIEPRKLDSVLRTYLAFRPEDLPSPTVRASQRTLQSLGARRADNRPVHTGRPAKQQARAISNRPAGEERPIGRVQMISKVSPSARRADLRPSGGFRASRPSGGWLPDRATTTQQALGAVFFRFFFIFYGQTINTRLHYF